MKILLRYEGQSHEIEADQLDMPESPNDGQIKVAVEKHLSLREGSLNEFEIDKYTEQAVIRPQAKFGR